MTALFREEVIAGQTDRLYGEVVLRQSVSTRVVTVVIVAVILACNFFVASGHYFRIETAKGVLVPAGQSSKVYALRSGVVSALLVRDGMIVAAGQQLAVVSADSPNDVGVRFTEDGIAAIGAQEVLARERISLAGEKATADRKRLLTTLDGLVRQEASLADELRFQQEVVSSTRSVFEQLGPVVEKGFVSKLEVERRRQTFLAAQQQEAQLRSRLDNTRTQIAQRGCSHAWIS